MVATPAMIDLAAVVGIAPVERAIITQLDEDGPVTTNIGVPGLWLVKPTDVSRLTTLLNNAWRINEIWDDEARANPGMWFMSHYTDPAALLFDVENGSGLIAFIRTVRSWRCQVYFAAWSRRAMRRHDLWTAAAKLAMLTNDLLVIDGFIKPDNIRSRRVAEACDMRYRGILRLAACYNGAMRSMCWYEIDRRTLGLDDIEVG